MKSKNIEFNIKKEKDKYQRLCYFISEYSENRDKLNEKLNCLINEYKEKCDELQSRANEENELKKNKEQNAKLKNVLQDKKVVDMKLPHVQREHAIHKATYDNYMSQKNELLLLEMKLKKENSKIKQEIQDNYEYIVNKKRDIENDKDYLEKKLKEEAGLRDYYDELLRREKIEQKISKNNKEDEEEMLKTEKFIFNEEDSNEGYNFI